MQGIFLFLIGVFVLLQSLYFYPRLPAVLANQSGAETPGDSIEKQTFFMLYYLVLAVTVIFFWIMPRLLNRSGSAQDSKVKSGSVSPPFMQNQIKWFGTVTLIFVVVLFWLLMENHLPHSAGIGQWIMWAAVGFYVVAALILCLYLLFQYSFSSRE